MDSIEVMSKPALRILAIDCSGSTVVTVNNIPATLLNQSIKQSIRVSQFIKGVIKTIEGFMV